MRLPCYLHHRYVNISPGRVNLKLRWTISSGTPPWDVIAQPEAPLEIDIHPADAKHLTALRERLECQLDIAGRSANAEAIEDVLRYMEGTTHSALVPFAWRIIGQNPAHRRIAGIWFAAQHSEDLHEADLRLARLLNDNDLDISERRFLFWCWNQREASISPDAFYLLTNSVCLRDRLLAYLYLNKAFDQRWVNKLLSDLPNLTQPLALPEFSHLLHDLDDDSYRVRETASAKLEELGERVEFQLRQELQTDLSPEAKRRVGFILERIAAAKKAPEWKPILEHLSSGDCDRDAALAVLRALAQGNPDAELTKAARASLDKLSSRK